MIEREDNGVIFLKSTPIENANLPDVFGLLILRSELSGSNRPCLNHAALSIRMYKGPELEFEPLGPPSVTY